MLMPQTRVILFCESTGKAPLLEWLDQLPDKPRLKCIRAIRRLAELGHELRRPEADLLCGGVYELRVSYQGINYRVLYFFHGRIAAVVSHGIIKERQVPDIEIERAIDRRAQFLQNPELHTSRESL